MSEDLAVKSEIWDELNKLFDDGMYGSAIRLVRDMDAESSNLSILSQHSLTLAELNKSNKNDPTMRRSRGYSLVAGYCFIKMGRMALAVTQAGFLKELPGSEKQVAQLEKAISLAFSTTDPAAPEMKPVTDLSPEQNEEAPELSVSKDDQHETDLFSSLTAEETQHLISKATVRELPKDAILFREGDKASAFYIVASGEMELSHGNFTKTFSEGEFFGEVALLGRLRRTATITAKKKSKLLEFSKELLDECMAKDPDVSDKLFQFYRKRLFYNVASRSLIFKDYSQGDLEKALSYFEFGRAQEGDTILHAGEKSDALYLICRGYMKVTKGDIQLGHLGPGQFVGEIGIISGKSRTADVLAEDACRYLKCNQDSFQELCKAFPNLRTSLEELAKLRDPELEPSDDEDIVID
jgi:CRP-like cAMP-binding protein